MKFVWMSVMFLVSVMVVAGSSAQAEEDPRVRALEGRIAALEAQNREILALLEELRGSPDGDAPHSASPELSRSPEVRRSEGREVRPDAVLSTATVVAGSVSPAGAVSDQGAVLPKDVAIGSSRLSFYGFVRLDAIFDDSRPNHPQFPSYILSEDPSLGPPGDSQFNFHPRLTRFGMNFSGPKVGKLGNATIRGKIEIDFQNGGSESREAIRMRHGWLELSGKRWSLLAGQTWDAFSPLYPTVNSDSLMWNAGNLGDRRPQIRVGYEAGDTGFSFVGGIGLTGAIDRKDLDGDGVRDGDDSSLPNLQTRFGFNGDRVKIGLWGHRGWEETTTTIAGEDQFTSYSVGVDYTLDLGERVQLKGELWSGSNLSDFRGGIGQGINRSTGEEIDSEGGWVELGVKLTEIYSVYGGFTLDDPEDSDLPAGGRTENRSWYLVNRFRLAPSFLVGIDFLHWTTEFKGLADGTDNRTNLYLTYNF